MANKRNKNQTSDSSRNANGNTGNIFFMVLSYCLLIIISPIVTFFASKYFLFDLYFESVPSNLWSAISAVVVLHVALGLFLYRAYFQEDDTKSRKAD